MLLCVTRLFGEEISEDEPISVTWQSVVGGDVVAAPKRTSYGFIMLSEGRIMNASTENGTIIWRRNIKGLPSQYFSVTSENFVYITTDNASKLSLYNPDGTFLWEVELQTPTVLDPFPGRDGRVFIAEENAISCYGVHGKRKWRTEVPKGAGLPLVEMNDGSLLYILDFTKNGASVAMRISPYGEKLEEIEFIDTITAIEAYDDGVLLGFANGAIGSCAVVNNVTETTGSVALANRGLIPKDIVIGSGGFSVLFANNSVSEYSLDDQSLYWSQKLPSTLSKDVYASYIDNTYVFASSEYVASYYAASTKVGGLLAWERDIKPVSQGSFPVVTHSAYLVLSHENWNISGYQLLDTEAEFTGVEGVHNRSVSYKGFRSASARKGDGVSLMAENLQLGDYGVQEAEYRRTIDNAISTYRDEYFSFIANSNIAEKSQTYTIASMFESSEYNYAVPLMLTNELDPYFTQLALQVATNIAYDPKEIMLKAIENYYNKNKAKMNENSLFSLCDAVYSICRYMGRPALTKRGKQILSDILQSTPDATVQKKVSDTLYLFIELEN